jgi:hypothetical protein
MEGKGCESLHDVEDDSCAEDICLAIVALVIKHLRSNIARGTAFDV